MWRGAVTLNYVPCLAAVYPPDAADSSNIRTDNYIGPEITVRGQLVMGADWVQIASRTNQMSAYKSDPKTAGAPWCVHGRYGWGGRYGGVAGS